MRLEQCPALETSAAVMGGFDHDHELRVSLAFANSRQF